MIHMHTLLQLNNLSLSFSHKMCFEEFNANIPYGSRIALIGRNGSGKSTLLKMLAGIYSSFDGTITGGKGLVIGYVPQHLNDQTSLSGGERFNKALTRALSNSPNFLLLDEPTNHLDAHNRKNLIKMLSKYSGTIVLVSHDTELLRSCVDTFWHIDHGKIHVFSGDYDDYNNQIKLQKKSIEESLDRLNRQKKDTHHKQMKEQLRALKSRRSGEKKIENGRWMKSVGSAKKMQAEKSQGAKLKAIDAEKSSLIDVLQRLRPPEVIVPTFSLEGSSGSGELLIQISEGSVSYSQEKPLLSNIFFSLLSSERVAITGANGSGKSTFIKALLADTACHRAGDWSVLKNDSIGYLDQHYKTLIPGKTVYETIAACAPRWPDVLIRKHLNDFLFRKNEEVEALINTLSGGERARLSLAQIAAKTPKLLILDEISNNLDLETKEHVIQVLRCYPGAMILISHDQDFLNQIEINRFFKIDNGSLVPVTDNY